MIGCGNCGHKWNPRNDFPKQCPECRHTLSMGLYYIENRGPVGNCMMFWGINGNGYRCNLDKAGRYSQAEAWSICRSRPQLDTMWPVEFIDRLAIRHVDIQSIKSGEPN